MSLRRGFTLIEVILAVTVVALVLAVIAPAMVGALRAQRQARRILEPLAQEQAALALFRADLASVRLPASAVESAFVLGAGDVGGQAVATLTCTVRLPPPLHPSLVVSAPDLGEAKVTWTLQTAADGRGLAWTRSSQANLLATGTVPDPVPEVVLDHLVSLTVEVFTDGAFASSYDSDEAGQVLPAGIRLSYRALGEDDTPGPLRIVVLDLAAVVLGGAS